MNSDQGTFVLRQLLNSTAIIGPILLLIGMSFYIFRQSRKSILIYLSAGIIFSLIGLVCLYTEFRTMGAERDETVEMMEHPASESARK